MAIWCTLYVVEVLVIIQCSVLVVGVHRKCSGIKGSMYKVMKTFVTFSDCDRLGLEVKKEDNFSEWYSQVSAKTAKHSL